MLPGRLPEAQAVSNQGQPMPRLWNSGITARHDMPDDLPVVLGDQREPFLGCDGVPQGVDQIGHDKTMVAERLQMNTRTAGLSPGSSSRRSVPGG